MKCRQWLTIGVFICLFCFSGIAVSPELALLTEKVLSGNEALAGETSKSRKEGHMTAAEITSRILVKDNSVINAVKQHGSSIVPSLIPLTQNKDPEVRELALYCLNEIGGEEARQAFLRALKDPSEDVQNRATLFLHRHATTAIAPVLIEEIKTHPDEYIRGELALVLAEVDYKPAIVVLRERLVKEPDEPTRKKYRLAMARLKDPESQNEILGRLKEQDIKVRYQALKDFQYMNDKSQVGNLLPLLNDKRDAVSVAPAGHKYFIRICDVTINVLDTVLGHPFRFQIGFSKRYSDQEISETILIVRERTGKK